MNDNKRKLEDDVYTSPVKRRKEIDLCSYINLVPTLQHIAAAKICVLLWRQNNFLKYLANHPQQITNHHKIWWPQKKKIRKQIIALKLSKRLEDIIVNFSDDIGEEMWLWIKANNWLAYCPKNSTGVGLRVPAIYEYLRNHLVYTTRGTVDYDKTALSIFNSESVTFDEKFHLACIHCYEDTLNKHFTNRLSEYKNLKLFKKEPLACYWACRIFPAGMTGLKMLLGLNEEQNINRRMLKLTSNDVTAKYLFSLLDATEKEQVLVELMTHFDINVQTYLFSQVNEDVRRRILTQHADVLERNVTFALWEDCILYYYHTYGSYITGPQCLKLLRMLHLTPEISYFQRFNVYIHELWNCVSIESKKYVVLHPQANAVVLQLLTVFLHFQRDDLVEELFQVLEDATVRITVSKDIPENVSVHCFDSFSNKCRFSLLNPKFPACSKKLRLVNDFISSKFPKNMNPLQYEIIRDDIRDVFVEYCRCKKIDTIDIIIKRYYKTEKEQDTYKSESFEYMFSKLLSFVVKQTSCFFHPIFQRTRPPVPVVCDDDSDIDFSILNSFLKWYFKSEEEINRFKIDTIYNKTISVVEELLEEKKHSKMKKLLKWFLLDDEEQINEFKNKCVKNKLISYF